MWPWVFIPTFGTRGREPPLIRPRLIPCDSHPVCQRRRSGACIRARSMQCGIVRIQVASLRDDARRRTLRQGRGHVWGEARFGRFVQRRASDRVQNTVMPDRVSEVCSRQIARTTHSHVSISPDASLFGAPRSVAVGTRKVISTHHGGVLVEVVPSLARLTTRGQSLVMDPVFPSRPVPQHNVVTILVLEPVAGSCQTLLHVIGCSVPPLKR